ncbi:hypothetical protein EC988_000427 [Linderina pennispora]|nr:hypothetical protein EC988_000427 [Linderina pennispora]
MDQASRSQGQPGVPTNLPHGMQVPNANPFAMLSPQMAVQAENQGYPHGVPSQTLPANQPQVQPQIQPQTQQQQQQQQFQFQLQHQVPGPHGAIPPGHMAMQRGGMLVGNLGPGGIRRPGTGEPDNSAPNQGLMIISSAPTASIPTSAPTPATAPKKAAAKPKSRKSTKKGAKGVANKSQAMSSPAMVMPVGAGPMSALNPPPAPVNRNNPAAGIERVASPYTIKSGVVSSNSGSSGKASASPALAMKAQQQQQVANAIATSAGGTNPMMGVAKPNINTPSPSFANSSIAGRNLVIASEGGDAGESTLSSILSQRGNQAAQQIPIQMMAGTTPGSTGDLQTTEPSDFGALQLSDWLTDGNGDSLSDIFNFGTSLGDQHASSAQAMGGFSLGDANFAHLIGSGGISGAMSMPLNMGTTSAPADGSSVAPAATQNNV